MSLFRAVKARPFALFLAGIFISGLGDSLYGIAMAWWIADRIGSSEAMGQTLAFAFLPRLVFLLLGGVISDRLPRLSMLMATAIGQGMVAALIAIWSALGRLETWHVYAASLLMGIMTALMLPANMAMIPDLAPKENLFSANSLISFTAQLYGVIGPGLSALVVQYLGYPAAFFLNAVSFCLSAFFLALMHPHLPVNRSSQAGKIQLWKDLSEGWRFVAGQAWLWASMLILLLVNFTGRSTMNVALPFLVRGSLQAGVGALGLFQSAFSMGSVVGAVWIGGRTKINRPGWIFYGCLFATGLLTAALGLPLPQAIRVASMVLIGVCLAINNLVWSIVLQERVPRAVLGRVASLSNASSTALLPFGFVLAGVATNLAGAEQIFLLGGALTALLALTGLLIPTTRRL